MLNKVKTKDLISVGAVAATSFILMMGYTVGQHSTAKQSRKEIELAAAKLVEDKQEEDKASILSSDTVKEFLTQYYTKEKLGENNARIQPLKQRIEDMKKWILFDTIGKVVGLALSATFFPPAMLLSVLLTLVVLVIPRQLKED